jgi:hypothetical protein
LYNLIANGAISASSVRDDVKEPARSLVLGRQSRESYDSLFGGSMLWPIVLVLLFLWLLGLVLDISGTYLLLIIAAILAVSNLLLERKRPA